MNKKVSRDLEKHQYINTYKIAHTETEILLEFGNLIRDEENGAVREVEVATRLAIAPSMLVRLIIDLFATAKDYEKKYKLELGFGSNESEETDKK